jgi:hypothetical protein
LQYDVSGLADGILGGLPLTRPVGPWIAAGHLIVVIHGHPGTVMRADWCTFRQTDFDFARKIPFRNKESL